MRGNNNKIKKYFTTGDVARYCEVNVNTVKNWIRNGNLQAFTTPSGHYRILRERFIDFVKEQGFDYDADYFGGDPDSIDILIIDDDPAHKDLTIYFLEQLYGNLKIETAENGFDGYVKLNQHRPQLVMLDLVMPGLNGLEFVKNLNTNPDLEGVKLLVVSGYLGAEETRELQKLKVDGILSKPVKKQGLKEYCDTLISLNRTAFD